MTRAAPAKINLTLEILGRRPDGYHDLMSVMQAISLCDTLTFEAADRISLAGGSEEAPPTEDNLVLRAARALDAATGGGHGARITLAKRIPVGAGLGGGSSDAATTLLALNEVWATGLSRDALAEIAAGIGSDVPFFLGTGTALAQARGERLAALDPPAELWIALAKPFASLATAAVYREYAAGPAPFAGDGRTAALADTLARGDLAPAGVAAALWNDLQPAATRLCPDIAEIQAWMAEAGALGTLVCGSGSAVFAVAGDEEHARRIAAACRPAAAWTDVAHAVSLPERKEEP